MSKEYFHSKLFRRRTLPWENRRKRRRETPTALTILLSRRVISFTQNLNRGRNSKQKSQSLRAQELSFHNLTLHATLYMTVADVVDPRALADIFLYQIRILEHSFLLDYFTAVSNKTV
jgi:hypothetical protein